MLRYHSDQQREYDRLPVRISVAGGINASTVQDVVRAGANIIVVGAAIYGAPSPAESARQIRELVDAV